MVIERITAALGARSLPWNSEVHYSPRVSTIGLLRAYSQYTRRVGERFEVAVFPQLWSMVTIARCALKHLHWVRVSWTPASSPVRSSLWNANGICCSGTFHCWLHVPVAPLLLHTSQQPWYGNNWSNVRQLSSCLLLDLVFCSQLPVTSLQSAMIY